MTEANKLPAMRYEALGSEGGAVYHDMGDVEPSKDRDEFHRRHAPIARITNNFESWNDLGIGIVTAVNAHDRLLADNRKLRAALSVARRQIEERPVLAAIQADLGVSEWKSFTTKQERRVLRYIAVTLADTAGQQTESE